jgi:hypothetical protein
MTFAHDTSERLERSGSRGRGHLRRADGPLCVRHPYLLRPARLAGTSACATVYIH